MQATLHKRHKMIIILLSLLINLLLVLPLILMKLDQVTQEAFVVFQQDPEETVAQHQPRPEPEELIEYILSSGAMPTTSEQEIQDDMAPQENPLLTQAQPGAQIEEEIEHESPIEDIKKEEQKEKSIKEETLEIQEEVIEKEVPQEPQVQQESVQPDFFTKLQEDAELKEQKEEEEEPKQVEPEKITPVAKPKPIQKPKIKQKKEPFGLSLGQISQGFMKSVQQEEGLNNPPQMDADKLVAHQYATKVWNIIKNSFRSDPNMLHLSQNIDTMAYLVITITKSGKLIDIHLEGNKVNAAFKQIEAMIVSHAKNAGLFPPLPKRFDVPQKTFTFPLHVQGHEGFHSYRLSYGPNR